MKILVLAELKAIKESLWHGTCRLCLMDHTRSSQSSQALGQRPHQEILQKQLLTSTLHHFQRSDLFSVELEVQRMQQMLIQLLTTQIPVASTISTWFCSLMPALCRSDTENATELIIGFDHALAQPWPTGSGYELNYTGFWEFKIQAARGAEDESITSPEGKRDYVCLVDSMLIIAGEDKTSKPQMAEADDDLLKKHVRSNRAMYGRLEYIILITTAGPLLEFTAMSIIPGRGLQELCPALEVLPMHKHQLFTKMARPTPYPELIYHLPNQVTLKLNHVEKSIVVPFLYLDDLVKTYRMLGSGAVPGACHVDKLEIDGDIMDLRARGWKLPVAPGDVGLITLTLRPVGMHLHIGSNAQLQSLIKQLLVTLTALHKQNWVHRDVRMDNLVHGPTGWVLID